MRIFHVCVVAVMLPASTGCVSAWWNAFLDPTQVGNFRENAVNEIYRTNSFRDAPSGIPNAVDPTPEDTVALLDEYRLGPGDMVQVRMLDFLVRNAESEFQLLVNELGNVDVPQLGAVRAEGLTQEELRRALAEAAQAKGIYRPDVEPIITITMLTQQQRLFNISGAVPQPGAYRIAKPDFRLREAVNLAGGLDDMIRTIYVFRNEQRDSRLVQPSQTSVSPDTGDEELTTPPVSPAPILSEMAASPAAQQASSPGPASRPEHALSLPFEETKKDLIEAVAPVGALGADADQAGEAAATKPANDAGTAMPPFIFVGDQFIEMPTAETQSTQTTAIDAAPDMDAPAAGSEQPVDWEELASEGQQRIIRIPADRLRSGDSSYNIVIRHQDWIRVDPGPVGTFYLLGHVLRPGSYRMAGEEITLTQAIAAAGGFDALAWPTRCDIRRRIDQDREEITQWDLARIIEGQDPDLFLKPGDVVNVGTHAIAPLLATIRNSFRLTYGFGFVYDRNFADIDAYYSNQNPDYRRRVELQQRFPGLFP